MNGRAPARLRAAAVAVGLIAYAALCHYSNSAERGRVLGGPLALAPFLIVAIGALRRSRRPAVGAVLAGGSLVGVYFGWPALERNFSWIYLLQECGFYGLLALGFARSLRRGATPLCTLLADQVHGPLSAAELNYTRAATRAWCAFFTSLSLLELLLFFTVPRASWSFFSYFCTLPLVLLMFIAEYAVRRRMLPETAGAGPWETMRIYFARSA